LVSRERGERRIPLATRFPALLCFTLSVRYKVTRSLAKVGFSGTTVMLKVDERWLIEAKP